MKKFHLNIYHYDKEIKLYISDIFKPLLNFENVERVNVKYKDGYSRKSKIEVNC